MKAFAIILTAAALLLPAASLQAQKKKKNEPAPVVEAPKPAEGDPDPKCGEAPYGMESAEIYSIFVESARTKDYETALMYGPWLACAHPKKMTKLNTYAGDKLLEKLSEVYEGYGLKKQNPAEKSRYLDSAAWALGRVLEVFADGGTDLFDARLNRGRFYQKHVDFIDKANDKAMADYEFLFKQDTKRATELAEGYYVQAILVNMVANDRKDDALATIAAAEPFASPALKEAFNQVRDKLFSNPEERIVFLNDKLKASPDDQASLNELFDILTRLKRSAEAGPIATRLYKLDPTYVNTVRVGDTYESNGDYKNAVKFYVEALGKATTDDQKKEVYMDLANNYINTGDLSLARDYARKTLGIDSKSGKALMAIARIYAQAVSACGGTIEREDKVVYWLAMDYAERARAADPSLSSYAEQQLKSFKSAAPSVEEKFFKAWKDGQKIKVDASLKACYKWIGEDTTVR